MIEWILSNLRDLFYSLGIIATLIISTIHLKLAWKNRKRGFQEHLYKEQLKSISDLTQHLQEVHTEMMELNAGVGNKTVVIQNIKNVSKVIYSNSHILQTGILAEARKILDSAIKFTKGLNTDFKEDLFAEYENQYITFLNKVRDEIGLPSLSEEIKKIVTGKYYKILSDH